jgi:NAD(P)-dependent dehydrogenase (short-subunit alcohol dehydrogenase family)
MVLKNKNAVIYGAGGAIGGAAARALALSGARVFLTGRKNYGKPHFIEKIAAAD